MSGWMGQLTAEVGNGRIRLKNYHNHERWILDRHKRAINVLSAGAKFPSPSDVFPRETSLQNVALRTIRRSD